MGDVIPLFPLSRREGDEGDCDLAGILERQLGRKPKLTELARAVVERGRVREEREKRELASREGYRDRFDLSKIPGHPPD